MAKKTIIINRFDGGMVDDIRSQSANSFSIARHFDIHTYPYRLRPYTSLVADETIGGNSTALQDNIVRNFLLASDGYLYGLGQAGAADDDPKILYKTTVIGGAWIAAANGEDTLGTVSHEVFKEYKSNLFFCHTDGTLRRYGDITSSPTINAVSTLDAAPTGQAIIGRDDNLYIPAGRYLHKITPAFAETTALTLPSDVSITSLEKYGNYLAIATEPSSNPEIGVSRLFLWDYTTPDVIESVDLGAGACKVIGNVEGQLIAILAYGVGNLFGHTAPKIVFRRFAGGSPVTIREISLYGTAGSAGGYLKNFKYVQDNRLFFAADLIQSSGSTEDEGIWSIGRKAENYPWGITLDIVSPSSAIVTGMASIGNYWWLANGSNRVYATTSSTYSTEPSYETVKINCGDSNRKKKLLGVALVTDKIGGDVTATIKYRKDLETSWTTIRSDTTDSSNHVLGREITVIKTTEKNLGEFNEIQFRIETSGGLSVVALKIRYEELDGVLEKK